MTFERGIKKRLLTGGVAAYGVLKPVKRGRHKVEEKSRLVEKAVDGSFEILDSVFKITGFVVVFIILGGRFSWLR